jgi:hypothetical protein
VFAVTDFPDVWRRIENHAGQRFRTKTGVEFTYRISNNAVVPEHTGYPLHSSQFRIAFEHMPLRGPGEINRLVRGPAYVFAIMTDPRILGESR